MSGSDNIYFGLEISTQDDCWTVESSEKKHLMSRMFIYVGYLFITKLRFPSKVLGYTKQFYVQLVAATIGENKQVKCGGI